jgi:hypothetical protein
LSVRSVYSATTSMPRVRVSIALVKNCALSTTVTPLAIRIAFIAAPPLFDVPRN